MRTLLDFVLLLSLPINTAAVEVPENWVEIPNHTNWCGASALWIVSRAFGKDVRFDDVRLMCDPEGRSDGMLSIRQLGEAAARLELASTPIHAELSWLCDSAAAPLISLHRNFGMRSPPQDGQDRYHFLVLVSLSPERIEYINPFWPNKIRSIHPQDFAVSWTGDVLAVSDDSRNLPSTERYWTWFLVFEIMVITVSVVLYRWRRRGIATALAVACALGTFGCENSTHSSTLDLQFDHTQHDAGVIFEGRDATTIRHSFSFVNHEQFPVNIKSVSPTCSCSTVNFTRDEIRSGGTGSIELAVDLRQRSGTFRTGAVVVIDSMTGSLTEQLVISSYVLAQVKITPTEIEFGEVPAGFPSQRDLLIRVPYLPSEEAPRIARIDNGGDGFICKLQSVEDVPAKTPANHALSKLFHLQVQTTADKMPGTRLSQYVTVEFHDRPGKLRVLARAFVRHPQFLVEPSIVNFGMIGDSPVRRSVVIRSADSTESLQLADFQVACPAPLDAWLEYEGNDHGALRLIVELNPGTINFQEGAIRLSLKSPDSPSFKLRYFGYTAN